MRKTDPLDGQLNIPKFFVFLDWLVSLGGTFTPVWEEPSTKRTGRRDKDKRAQVYPLGFHKAYWKMQKEAEIGG